MPGHKRRGFEAFNPYEIDITEIEGFDNLHNATGLIKETEERAAKVFGADRTFLLVNGTTGGMLSAVYATVNEGEVLLMSRNCHKCTYNAAIVAKVDTEYLYPVSEGDFYGAISPEMVAEKMDANPRIKTVVIVSPTYEGIVSPIKEIAEVIHERGGVLIVDEAHGSHMRFCEGFPEDGLSAGVDIVIHSIHKTLPSFTQTALLHVKGNRVDIERLKSALAIFQTSSPSYILMAGIDRCITFLEEEGKPVFSAYVKGLQDLRTTLGNLKHIKLFKAEYSKNRAWYDPGKVVLLTRGTNLSGADLMTILRDRYRIECEMAGPWHVIAMTSVMDTPEGFERLAKAVIEIDKSAEIVSETGSFLIDNPRKCHQMWKTVTLPGEYVDIASAAGRISEEFLYLYPPGIPLVVPGEEITGELVANLDRYRDCGLEITGFTQALSGLIKVVI